MLFEQPEWDSFTHHTRLRPVSVPLYVLDILRLFFRRSLNVVRIRAAGKGHLALKQWPDWLGPRSLAVKPMSHDDLRFPHYPEIASKALMEKVPQIHFEEGDGEGYFAAHRWGHCVGASLSGLESARSSVQEVLSWISKPSARHDPAWEPYSTSERVVNLAVMLSVHRELWNELEPGKKTIVVDFFVESAQWINDHLEYYGQKRTNNHILNNARALVVAGSVLGDQAVLYRGLLLFAKMSHLLVLQDGSLRERSSHYQGVVTTWILDVLRFALPVVPNADTEIKFVNELAKLSDKMADVTSMLLGSAFKFRSHIGDISPDSHPLMTARRLQCLYSDKISSDVGSSGKSDDWIHVVAGTNELLSCAVPSSYPVQYKTHGHSDLGSFIWAVGSQAVLVDRGRSSYDRILVARQQCGATGHNVLMVNHLPALSESVLYIGEWIPVPYARASVDTYRQGTNGFTVEHNGFSRIPRVGVHRRTVTADGDHIQIHDQLDGNGVVDVELIWHFSPDLSPVSGSSSALVGKGLRIEIEMDTLFDSTSWDKFPHSTAYGDLSDGYVLNLKSKADLPWSCITRMKALSCAV